VGADAASTFDTLQPPSFAAMDVVA